MATLMSTRGRTYGIEFETVGLEPGLAAQVLLSMNVPAYSRGYGRSDRDDMTWECKYDGSLPDGSCEVVSPVLRWGDPDHYNLVNNVLRRLRSAGAGVNIACGTHVHVGIDDLDRDHLVRMVMLYAAVQDSIDQNVSPSRRHNTYANPVPSWVGGRSEYLWSYRSGAMWQWADFECSPPIERYSHTNLMSVGIHSTVEFRQRNGTLNSRKIFEWTGLMMGLLTHAAGMTNEQAMDLPYRNLLPADREAVWEFLARDLDPEAAVFHNVKGK